MFMRLFGYRLKVLMRQKMMLFWTLAFPLILATLFNLAFSNLAKSETFDVVSVGIVDDSQYQKNTAFKTMVTSLGKGEDALFKLTYVKNETEAKEKLDDNKIAGYYKVEDPIKMVIKQNGTDASIMKLSLEKYYQGNAMGETILKENPKALQEGILNEMGKRTFTLSSKGDAFDVTVIYFYTLIGMVCMYAGFFGISAVCESEANQSTKGARLQVAPTHKLKSLLAFLLAGWLIQVVFLFILLAYMILVLQIDFGNQLPYVLLIVLVGSFAGLTAGTFVGAVSKAKEDTKISIFVNVSLILSFLSGMMIVQMKYWIMQYAPFLAQINPVSMITDALYSLYYYTTYTRYFFNVGSLLLFSVVMIFLSYFLLRRKKYDSL